VSTSKGKAWTNVRPGTYSVWNWKRGEYDYYQGPPESIAGYGDEVVHPPARAVSNPIGEDPDFSSHVLPRGSKRIGGGPAAVGEVAMEPGVTAGVGVWGAIALAIVIPTALLVVTTHFLSFKAPEEDEL
jgi:hypothetical protein